MYEKFFIIIGEQVICLKYNLQTGEMVVGGNVRFRVVMERILEQYIVGHVPRAKFTQANKVRFVFQLSRKRYDTAIDDLRNNNFVVERVQSHGRLMR